MSEKGLSSWLEGLRAALQFLTRFPVGRQFVPSPEAQANALLWYPVAGLAIGCLLVLAHWLIAPLPMFLSAALLVALWVAVTGGLHLDGLADCADAWVAGIGDRQKTLDVMKDPRCGPTAVVVLVLFLVLKIAAVAALISSTGLLLLMVPMLARLVILPAFLWMPYARAQGLGTALAEGLAKEKVQTVLFLMALVPILWMPLVLWLLLLVVTAIVFFYWRRRVMARLQGFTGDCIGALVELTELALLLAAVCYQVML